MNLIPTIFQKDRYGEKAMDLWSKLFSERIIYLSGHIEIETADLIVGQLLFLEYQNPNEPITMYINSPGGVVNSALAIYDVMNSIKPEVHTLCVGQAASAAAVLLSSGTKGYRSSYENAEIMFHQVKSGNYGSAPDVEISVERVKSMNQNLLEIIAYNCDKPYEQILSDLDRDFFLTAKQAYEYGAIDYIIPSRLSSRSVM